jgi:tocopherol cyclase
MHIDIQSDEINAAGDIYFSNMVKYPQSLTSPGIMGWYSYVPFMECKHGVISIFHDLKGSITINDNIINFDKGRGYIEKDWGTSFPEDWLWVHSNTFENSDASLMISAANIPWMNKYFTGFTSFLYYDGKLINFSSYNKSKISKIEKKNNNEIFIKLENRKFILETSVNINNYGKLKAPVLGEMNRNINESINSELNLKLYDNNGKLIFEDYGKRVGFELTEGLLNYFI